MSSLESQSATSVSYSLPSDGNELGVMGRHSLDTRLQKASEGRRKREEGRGKREEGRGNAQ
ncbi:MULTISPECIES: hypothetical protein [unclassified Microcoleus]|uniref:hypothetical protein n=1 Tax=unclassified Microcoleus TaxID=2642155 RepID=UPI002FD6044D